MIISHPNEHMNYENYERVGITVVHNPSTYIHMLLYIFRGQKGEF